jgi:hypothetical protein
MPAHEDQGVEQGAGQELEPPAVGPPDRGAGEVGGHQVGVIGSTGLVERLLIGLLTGGHLLIEGAPGLAKTRAQEVAAGEEPDQQPLDEAGRADQARLQAGPESVEAGPSKHRRGGGDAADGARR